MEDLFRELGDNMRDYSESIGSATERAKRIAEQHEKLNQSLDKLNSSLTKNINRLASGDGSFQGLQGMIESTGQSLSKLGSAATIFAPGMTKAIGLAGIAAGEMLKLSSIAITFYDKLYKDYEKLAQLGIVTIFDDLRQSINTIGLSSATTTRILTRYSKEFAAFGGSAISGREKLEELTMGSIHLREKFQRVGVSQEQFVENQVEYMRMMALQGRLTGKEIGDLSKETETYNKQLTIVSRLTGLQAKDLNEARLIRMADTRFRAGISNLPDDIKNNINTMMDILEKNLGAGKLSEGLKDIIASGTLITDSSKAAAMMFRDAGIDALEFGRRMRTGQMDAAQAIMHLVENLPKTSKNIQRLASIIGDANIASQLYTEVENLKQATGVDYIKQQEKIKKLVEDGLSGKNKENKNLADTTVALQKIQKDIELLGISFSSVTDLMNEFAEVLAVAVGHTAETFKQSLPPFTKAKLDETKILIEQNKLKERLNELDETEKEYRESKGLSAVIPGIKNLWGNLPTVPGMAAERGSRGQVTNRLMETQSELGKVRERLGGLKPESAGPGGTQLASEMDSRMQSVEKWVTQNIPGATITSRIGERPNNPNSKHPLGLAFDFVTPDGESKFITPDDPNIGKARAKEIADKIQSGSGQKVKVIDEYNTKSPDWTRAHFHVEAAFKDGGYVDKPTVSLVGEGGPEAVVPLSGGRSIPVQLDGTLARKLDSLISITEQQNRMLSNVFDRLT